MTVNFPISRTCPFSPPDEYERLREQAPLVRARVARGEIWLVTRHAEAQRVLSDPTISTDPATPGHPMPAMRPDDPSEEELKIRRRFQAGQFIDMDPPEHSLYRRMLIPEFTVRRVREMRPAIQEATDLLIDDMLKAGSPTDLVDAFGFALPSMVTCALLGVPYADRDFFRARTRKMMDTGVGSSADGIAAAIEVWHYLEGLVTEAEREPGDDLIGRLVVARREGGELTRDALVGMIFLLLIAGHETTANMIPLGVASVSAVQNASGFATFAAGGVHREAHVIRSITDANGKTTKIEVKGKRAFTEQAAIDATYALTQVVTAGTGSAARLYDRPVAGKTGTTDKSASVWFAGFTPQLAVAVDMFRDDNKPVVVDGSALYGGTYPAQVWRAFMTEAMAGKPVEEFAEPSNYGYSNYGDTYRSDADDHAGDGTRDDTAPPPQRSNPTTP
ncbi:penicillin-binding transpeptidase domain-containing protein, partial [Streptosporangium algeriense]